MSIYLGSQAATVYLGAVQVTSPGGAFLDGVQVFPAGPSVPGAPTITNASYSELGGASTSVTFSAPASDGGSAITSYKFYFDDVLVEPSSITSSANFSAQDYRGEIAEVSAVNAVGEGPRSAPFVVV